MNAATNISAPSLNAAATTDSHLQSCPAILT